MLIRRPWLKYPDLHIWADGNSDGPLVEWAKNCYGYELEIVVKPESQVGFSVLPRRWVVERTFAWLGQWRRLSKDYEQSPRSEEAFIQPLFKLPGLASCLSLTGLTRNTFYTHS